jgi:hypothetical protein
MRSCTHRWLLSAPGKQTVRAICRRCGARKAYPAGLEVLDSASLFEELKNADQTTDTEVRAVA